MAEKWLQLIIDIIRGKGCATRRYIIDSIVATGLTQRQAETVVDETLESLLKRGIITRRGRGVYCWAGPP